MKAVVTLLIALSVWVTPCFANMAVIVHPSNLVELTKADITHIFTGKTKLYPSGSLALPINAAEQSLKNQFNRGLLNKSSHQVRAYWSKLMFTGRAMPPIELDGTEVLERVANDPKAIGYITENMLTDNVRVVYRF